MRLTQLIFVACTLAAAPALTTIQDTIYNADGSPFSGTAYIQWKAFTASDKSPVASSEIAVPIRNGQLLVRLVPTVNAVGGAFYSVRFSGDGKNQFNEIWVVPSSPVALKLKDVQVPGANAGSGGGNTRTVQISDIPGLQESLELKVDKAPGFAPSRAAVIDGQGKLTGVVGSPADCVRVDGSSGLCGTPVNFVDLEVPTGSVDGVNRTFTLSIAPNPALSLHLYRNGILLRAGIDYSLSGAAITFTIPATPTAGDLLQSSYRH